MMFVSGETAEPSTETTALIEEIVRQQVVEMVGISDSQSLLHLTNCHHSSPGAHNLQAAVESVQFQLMIFSF